MFKGHRFQKRIILQTVYFKFAALLEKEFNKKKQCSNHFTH